MLGLEWLTVLGLQSLRDLKQALQKELGRMNRMQDSLSTSHDRLSDWAESWISTSATHSSVFWEDMRQQADHWTTTLRTEYADMVVEGSRTAVQAVSLSSYSCVKRAELTATRLRTS